MNTKLAYPALAVLALTIAVYVFRVADDPTVIEPPESDAPIASPEAKNNPDSEKAASAETRPVESVDRLIIPDMTAYDVTTLLQMVDHDADAAFELGFRRYGRPVLPMQGFGNSQAREFFLRAIALEPRYAEVAIPIMMEFDRLPTSEQEAPSWGANRRLVAALLGERLGVEIDIDAEFEAYREIVPSERIHEEFREQADTLLWRIAIHRSNVTGDRALLDQVEEERT